MLLIPIIETIERTQKNPASQKPARTNAKETFPELTTTPASSLPRGCCFIILIPHYLLLGA